MKMFPPITPPPGPDFPLIDNAFAPEIMVTGLSGLAAMNGLLTMTLESLHCDHSKSPPPMERVVVARIALPIAAAQGMLLGLHEFLGQHGLNPLSAMSETRQ